MRVFEISILLVISISPFLAQTNIGKGVKKVILFIIPSVALLHILLEGWRWQMIPAYLFLAFLCWRVFKGTQRREEKVIRKKVLAYAFVSGIILICWIPPLILPVFQLPKPTGQYKVGTQDIYLKTKFDEPITPDTSDYRELMLKVWYPTSEVSQIKDPYVDKGGRNGFAIKYGLPIASMNYLDYVETHVYREVPVADDQFPVLIFSHGLHAKATGYYALLSEIASHGYVIVNINHTYESAGTIFPDGRLRYFDTDYSLSADTPESREIVSKVIEAYKQGLSFEERHEVVRKALKEYDSNSMVARWSNDIRAILDELEEWNNKGFLSNRLDLSRVGAFGHSRGGAAAAQSLIEDDRVRAAINLDGSHWGNIVDTIFQKPFLYLSSDWPPEHHDLNEHAYVNKSSSYFYEGRLLSSGHSSFMDIPYMITLKKFNNARSIEKDLAIAVSSELVIHFFENHLNGSTLDVEKLGEKYELLKLKVHRGDSVQAY